MLERATYGLQYFLNRRRNRCTVAGILQPSTYAASGVAKSACTHSFVSLFKGRNNETLFSTKARSSWKSLARSAQVGPGDAVYWAAYPIRGIWDPRRCRGNPDAAVHKRCEVG